MMDFDILRDENVIPANRCRNYVYKSRKDSEPIYYNSNEIFYRDMFERSAIKIKLCDTKVYFLPDPQIHLKNFIIKSDCAAEDCLQILLSADKNKNEETDKVILEALKDTLNNKLIKYSQVHL